MIPIVFAKESSLITVYVFIGDSAIPDTSDSNTATHVINGSDADVVIIQQKLGVAYDGFYYDIPIDEDKYYAVTVTTASTNEPCNVSQNPSGGPVKTSVTVQVFCRSIPITLTRYGKSER